VSTSSFSVFSDPFASAEGRSAGDFRGEEEKIIFRLPSFSVYEAHRTGSIATAGVSRQASPLCIIASITRARSWAVATAAILPRYGSLRRIRW
jgi:hypothetical protein